MVVIALRRGGIHAVVHLAGDGLELADLLMPGSRAASPPGLPDDQPGRAVQATPVRALPEAEILAMISRGMTNPEIAHALVLSNHTIKSHINRIFTKTRSRDRAAATGYAQARNLQ